MAFAVETNLTLTVERVLPDGIIACGCQTSDLRMTLPPPPSGFSADNRPTPPTTYCPNSPNKSAKPSFIISSIGREDARLVPPEATTAVPWSIL